MAFRNFEDLLPIIAIPFGSIVTMAVVAHMGRHDLLIFPVIAGVLMSVCHMAFFVGGELVEADRNWLRFELLITSRVNYAAQLVSRIFVLNTLGLFGALLVFIIADYGFDANLRVYHPGIFVSTLVVTIVASTFSALLVAAIFSMGRTSRTFQNAFSGPLFLISGVYVPVDYLPDWLQPLANFSFVTWAAKLLRAALQPAEVTNWAHGIFFIVALGSILGCAGVWALNRMIATLVRDGKVSLL